MESIGHILNYLRENEISIPDTVWDFIQDLTPADVGREVINGEWIVRFEGFTDDCILDVSRRLKLPKANPHHLNHFEDVYDEVYNQWEREEGLTAIDKGFSGSEDNPIQYAIFYKAI